MRIFIVTLSIIAAMLVFYRCTNNVTVSATYVGTDKCGQCHQKEMQMFKLSDHYHAMDTVSTATVKGDFNNSRFIYHGDTAFFYQKNSNYFVRTTDSTGIKKEFQIIYTFGWQPLQQYLVKFNDGRIQVLPFCWDTRAKEKGGQHWYHLYDKENISHTDELFWMGYNQNWNYMCADCHTTNYKKNYQAQEDKFNSTWSESRVSCESCHGPASEHMKWAEKKNGHLPFKGFAISLAAKETDWKMDANRQTMLPQTVLPNDTLIETCARCHARATRFADVYWHGQSFLQSHIPATADAVNYYVDGQIKEEDYEYASFLQSKMHAAGVTCINCHEPHSMKVKAIGNSLCISCHAKEKYDGPQHSFHKSESTGNDCKSCHMPATNYMVIDTRFDHSIRIPRPDQSLTMGTPNACNKCHTDKPVKWAADNFTKWFANKLPKESTYADLMFAVSRFVKESEPSLYQLLQNKNYPAIIRATALEQYSYYTSSRVSTLVFEELKNENPFMRLSAVKAMRNYPPETIMMNVPHLLNDKVAAVRMEAMNVLAPDNSKLSETDTKRFKEVMIEYMNVQEQMSHRPEGFFNRAILLNFTGDITGAEQLYLQSIKRFPDFIPSYSNLIDLYRQQNREAEAKQIADKGLMRQPNNSFLHYALGLWYIRNRDNAKGVEHLKLSAEASPADPQMVYGYSIALFSTANATKAVQLLEQFIKKYGNQPLILDGLISICGDMKNEKKAAEYATIRKEVFGH